MSDDTTPSNRSTAFSRRRLIAVLGGTMIFPVGQTTADTSDSQQATENPPQNDAPEDVARAYIEALDGGDRTEVNELIAPQAKLDKWSQQEFVWVDSFEIEYVGFEKIKQRTEDLIADIKLRIAGNRGAVRYRFRETADGWAIWGAIDGLRSPDKVAAKAEAVAEAYVTALDAGSRGRVNELIADDGALAKWSSSAFEWVGAFDFEFVDFRIINAGNGGIIGDIELEIGGNSDTVRYRFQETAAGGVKLWTGISGLRTTGKRSARAVANAYVEAIDTGDRKATNDLIAAQGELEPWSKQDFEWVEAFSVTLVDFQPTTRQEDTVVAELTVQLGAGTEAVTYEFRRVGSGWKLWKSREGIR